MFKSLEEKNMFLIHRSQESESLLHDTKQKRVEFEKKIERDSANLKLLVSQLKEEIENEKVKQKSISEKIRSKGGDAGDQYREAVRNNDEEAEIKWLQVEIEDVYLQVVSDNVAGMNAIQMLAAIERRMHELTGLKETLPADYVSLMEKQKEAARRQKMKDEKVLQKAEEEKAKIQNAIERSTRQVTRKIGKSTMVRTYLPPKVDKKEEMRKQKLQEEMEDMDYFGLSESQKKI
eukprot:TRINITY_DN2041_c1_g2_i1.p1 TRINITY_DN2041_c1_g2~~TRINITY_DN2041_c1_g2_i1.p1  ORF type:complete len:234 (-),score=99.17 TRINITY_DN2041_c1_g2_i1:11-712(-)